MLNCFKRVFLVSLLLYIPFANAMKKEAEQDKLDKGLWTVIMTTALSEQDFKRLEEHLDKGANPNAQLKGEIPLTWAVYRRNIDLLKFFIQQGADINLKNSSGWTPLGYSILGKQLPYIETLCDSGALLVNSSSRYYGANAFHCAVELGKNEAKEIIKMLMTHGRFDSYDKNRKEKERKLLTVLSGLSVFPEDVQFRILNQLVLTDDTKDADAYSSNKKLGKKLLSLGYNGPILVQISKRVENLTKILDSKDNILKQTPSEWVDTFKHVVVIQDKEEIRALLKKEELQKNWDNFNAGFPDILKSDPGNPICEMYNNCTKLLEGKK